LGEVFVEGLDEGGLGAEVGGEAEDGEREVAEAAGLEGLEEALDAGLTKGVDGLPGIADEEDGLGVGVPAAGEELDEFVLGGAGVLHFVDEEVLEAEAGGGGEVVECGVVAEGGAGEEADFGEVALGAFGEDELELGEGAGEDAEEGFGDLPLLTGILGGREIRDLADGFEEAGEIGELGDDLLEFELVMLQDFEPDIVAGDGFAPDAGFGGLDDEME
jgi:hypothetical protein